MASVRQGMRTAPNCWWKHLDWMSRPYWKGERAAVDREIRVEAAQALAERARLSTERAEYLRGERCGCCWRPKAAGTLCEDC